ncbi:hypothetical protein SF660363_2184 [Shigella flexneri 6603-63]|nr:hypothetical protein SF660363_2184 [Shigella flexneri 6603-63]
MSSHLQTHLTTSTFNVLCHFSGIKNRSAAGFAYFTIAYKIGKVSDLHEIYAF